MEDRRRQRARNGSRRQRDLEAARASRPDWNGFIAQHFPDESYGYVLTAAQRLYLARPERERRMPTPDEVREHMRSRGWLREQQAAL